jgi:hypothetical protein
LFSSSYSTFALSMWGRHSSMWMCHGGRYRGLCMAIFSQNKTDGVRESAIRE